ncbi:hypothetical protein LOTGIDRAFT_158536 [Lottia gigantea]|uniref:EGF-like domain-containing protein n=1 Tax=Lottia gigantea TaxID=225164 RepID=V4AQF0_LOTGI|nr:hypothetical protein LOTGIDRAFT_158536 [Lottia gigantea]ESO99452.1 hypothetical protein LOTGIDRAFT_158536 [Lottia gigantea]
MYSSYGSSTNFVPGECNSGVCFNGGQCRGGYSQSCSCPPGFQGPRCQYDVNECGINNGGCERECCNSIGSFKCKCPQGFELAADGRRCTDIDECRDHNGGCQHKCLNTDGGFSCECPKGQRLHADGRTCIDTEPLNGYTRVNSSSLEAVVSFKCLLMTY